MLFPVVFNRHGYIFVSYHFDTLEHDRPTAAQGQLGEMISQGHARPAEKRVLTSSIAIEQREWSPCVHLVKTHLHINLLWSSLDLNAT